MVVKRTEPITKQESDYNTLRKHKDEIRDAATDAKNVIASAASEASKVIAEAAAVSVKVLSIKNADDHDLLIELKIGNQFIRDDIKSLSNGVSTKIEQLEISKANKTEFDLLVTEIRGPREERIRAIEDKSSRYMITVSLLMIAVGALFTLMLLHIFK